MKRLFITSILLLSLCSCLEEGTPVDATGQKGDFRPEFLFEVDGIRVYRFYDGRSVYFTSTTSRVEWKRTTSNGKRTVPHHEQTVCQENR